jgi:hypothetical protein
MYSVHKISCVPLKNNIHTEALIRIKRKGKIKRKLLKTNLE